MRYAQRSYVNAAGDSIRYLSAAACIEEWQDASCGDGEFHILEGYGRMLDALSQGLDIRLNTPVTHIDWSGAVVRLETHAGTMSADQVVITVPLGVLQAGMIAFSPALPAAKQSAIEALRMGPGIKLVFKLNDHPVSPDIMAIYSDKTPSMWWSPSYGHETSDIVWTAFATGDHARHLLERGEEGALDRALAMLRLEVNRPDLKALDRHLMNWVADPYIRGAYSVTTPGHLNARDALAQPTGDKLFWAGEATMRSVYTATVHGAYVSGQRAAQAILNKRRDA